MVELRRRRWTQALPGVSTSQAPHQVGELGEHIPSFFATDAETDALAATVRRKGKRLMSINPRSKREGLSRKPIWPDGAACRRIRRSGVVE